MRALVAWFIVATTACSVPGALDLGRIEPSSGPNTVPVDVRIHGVDVSRGVRSNVDTGKTTIAASVTIGGAVLERATIEDAQTIAATVPPGLAPGTYDVTVELGAERASLAMAYTVTDGSMSSTSDASPVTDANIDPTTVRYVYSLDSPLNSQTGVMYRFDTVTRTFMQLLSTNCPAGLDTAVLPDGRIFVTSTSSALYSYTELGGCTLVSSNTFSDVLGGAPDNRLIGYQTADYVQIDTATWQLTIAQNALAGANAKEDFAAIGNRGFVVIKFGTGPCPASAASCIVEVDLATGGIKSQSPTISLPSNLYPYGLANGGGKLLIYSKMSEVLELDFDAGGVPQPIATFPTGINFLGAGSAPY